MFTLSLATFRERRQLFAGAFITVVLGVALVQSSLLILVTAAGDGQSAAVVLLGMTLALSVFLAIFIVSSTFAFTIAQRRRGLALLRLVGGSRGQLRRLLLSEAFVLGLLGTAAGVPAGLLAMRTQTAMLASLGFVPGSFTASWHDWILAVSAGIGLGVAQLGVLAAARRASRVRPLEALRDLGQAARVMTFSRWFFGLVFLGGAIALMIVGLAVDSEDAAIAVSVNATFAAAIGLSALSPLVVPPLGKLLGALLGRSTLGTLARGNLRDGVRRSASTAAPLLVLVALVVGISGMFSTLSEGSKRQLAADIDGDLVATGPVRPGTPGVAAASTEYPVPVEVTTVKHDDVETEDAGALAVDAADYQRAHRTAPVSGSLADLHGDTVAVAGGELGAQVRLRVGDQDLTPRVVAVLPMSLGGGPEYLLPQDLVPPAALGQARSIVRLRPGADAAAVSAALPGPVSTVDEWLAAGGSEQDATNAGIMKALLGLAALYAVIAVVNAVVIAAGERPREFAVARLTGLSRGQVVRTALLESTVVTVTGLVLGALAAAATLGGVSGVAGTVVLPWAVFGLVAAGAFAVVAATSVGTSLAATRRPPVSLAGAAE